jgi:KDO2-lipid IV(A) lauroyltransferase
VVPVSDLLRIRRLFKQGWHLVLAGDFDSTGSGISVPFFGAPARMPDGAVQLALRTGAPLLIVSGWRERPPVGSGRVRFRLCVSPPVPLAASGDFRADVQQGVQTLLGQLEPIIAAHLDQWLALRPIWPPGESGAASESKEVER